jgi:endo-1,3(4)-beta-glucanase
MRLGSTRCGTILKLRSMILPLAMTGAFLNSPTPSHLPFLNIDSTSHRKSVIYCALSNVDAKTAATFSSNLGSWGSGNTYTNQLYFISTRPSSSGICSSAFQFNPTGNFTLREVSSNRYVTSSSANVNLYANATSAANATVYTLGFAPGGGTIYAANNAQYVTADSSGNFTLGAARTVASTWEEFVIRPKKGAASGVYTILAQSNKMYVVRGSDGGLKNNGATEAAASGFALTNA